MTEKTAARARLPQVMAADAVWDGLLGAALCLASWPAATEPLGLPVLRPWPVFALLGLVCLASSVVLARGSRGTGDVAIARIAAIGNAAAAVVAAAGAVLLAGPSAGLAVACGVIAVGCAAFAVPEWLLTRDR